MSLKSSCITCCPGSGSTVFARLLNIHPEILSVHELGLFSRSRLSLLRRMGSSDWVTESQAMYERTSGFLEKMWKIDDIRLNRIRILGAACGGGMVLSRELVKFSGKPGVNQFIDKIPDPVRILRFLKNYPGLRIIYLHRNPYAVVNSILRKTRGKLVPGMNWGPMLKDIDTNDTAEVLAARQYCSCLDALQAIKEIRCEPPLEVFYEDFVSTPVDIYREVFEFLGVPVSGAMMLEVERMFKQFPLRSGRADGWQAELSAGQKSSASSIFNRRRNRIPGRYEISGSS